MKYPHDHENDIIYFGKTNFRNALRKFGVKTDDRRRHMYVIGKTGMGKTTLLENLILSDIYAGHGCCYIDPHGDTAERLIDYIPSWRTNDVVYFNPSDLEYPIGFNILESIDDEMKHLVAAGMMGVFKKIWEGVWSARMEYILNNTILALMDTPGTTLLGVNRMLSDEEYRNMVIMNITDPIVKQFWIKEFGSYQQKFASEAVAPIQNKVGQFLSSSVIRNIVAQAQSAMQIRKVMDDEKIFIVNLSKGRIGEDASRLLGGLIITKIQMSAMERVDTPEDQRPDFYMYVDEFQNFAVESFASILSEARKYRLNLIMAHQYIAQLTEEVRDAVFGNVGTIVSFRVGSPDATFMEEEFMPRFTPNDMINLPKFHIYLKLMIDGVTSQPFSALTLPPIAQRTHSTEKVIAQSRERYAGNRQKIEEKVAEWSGFGEGVDVAEEMEKVKSGKKAAKKARFSHSYDCTRCGKTFQLPVELDRSRPIYCEDCHPIVMEERKSGKKRADKKTEKRQEKKKVVDKPPKVKDGEVVKKEVPEEAVSLEMLNDKKKPEEKPRRDERKKKQKDSSDESSQKERATKSTDENAPTAKDVLAVEPERKEERQERTERSQNQGDARSDRRNDGDKQDTSSDNGDQRDERKNRRDDREHERNSDQQDQKKEERVAGTRDQDRNNEPRDRRKDERRDESRDRRSDDSQKQDERHERRDERKKDSQRDQGAEAGNQSDDQEKRDSQKPDTQKPREEDRQEKQRDDRSEERSERGRERRDEQGKERPKRKRRRRRRKRRSTAEGERSGERRNDDQRRTEPRRDDSSRDDRRRESPAPGRPPVAPVKEVSQPAPAGNMTPKAASLGELAGAPRPEKPTAAQAIKPGQRVTFD